MAPLKYGHATKVCNSKSTHFRDLQERIDCLESDASKKYDKISHLESNLGLSEAECRELKSELHVINQVG